MRRQSIVGNPAASASSSNVGGPPSQDTRSRRRRLSTFSPPGPPSPPPSPSSSAALPPPHMEPAPPGPTSGFQRRPKPGILRLDMNKPRRSSGGSVEFRAQPQLLGEDITSPSSVTSPHQLSVTWATHCDFNEEEGVKLKPMHSNLEQETAATTTTITPSSTAITAVTSPAVATGPTDGRRIVPQDEQPPEFAGAVGSPVHAIDYHRHHRPSDAGYGHEFRRGSSIHQHHHHLYNGDYENETNYNYNEHEDRAQEDVDDEDYSISVSAIMQRRASIRGYRNKRGSRSSRRASSPMDHVLDNAERRRSSVYTTSSDEGTNQESTQEQIFENIRLHKEVIQSVKLQPWPIRKKLKLVRQAKTYVARHEGALQERFAMSRSTRDLWARFKILMAARWRHWKRETTSFLTVLIPWELRIKEIESHFGSGVASYFTFLRWLMWVNIMIAIPLVAFVIGPEYFATKHDEADPRKKMSDQEYKVAGNLFTIWEFEGYLKYSPMFYGYYSSISGASSLGYRLPLAYFLTAVVVYIYSFVATLRKMAENSRNSKLSSKDDECTFSWKLFTGWDFMIGHAETAHNRIASVVVGFKEALLEEAEKKKDNRNWRIILQRILVNILVMGLLAASGYTVVALVNNAEKLARHDNWLSRNAVNVTMALLSFFLPMIFEALGLFENWHPRQQLRLQLARIMILNMLNLYSLMFSFIYKINSKEKPLQVLKMKNETASQEYNELTELIAALKSATTTTLGYQDLSSTLLDDSSTISNSNGDFFGSGIGSTTESLLSTTAAIVYSTVGRLKCYNITVKCSKPTRVGSRNLATTSLLLLLNLTTTMLPPTPQSTIDPLTTTNMWTTSLNPETTTMMPETTTMMPETTTKIPEITTMQPKMTPDLTTMPEIRTTTMNPETTIPTTWPTTPPWTTTSEEPTTTTTPTSKPLPSTLTTVDDDDLWSTTTGNDDDEDSSSTTPQTSTTTTPSPGNDSFFEYYDYFVGMPIDMDVDEELDNDKATAEDAAPEARRVPRAAAAEEEDDGRAPRKSNYSRRSEGSRVRQGPTPGPASEDYAEPTTTTARAGRTWSWLRTRPTTLASTRTTTTEDLTTMTTTASPGAAVDGSTQSVLWEPNEKLRKLVDYFANMNTTREPTTTSTTKRFTTPKTTTRQTTMRSTTTRSATARTTTPPPSTTTIDPEDRTPYFIGEDEIDDIGEANYYDANELDEENFESCIRTICEPADMYTSTESDAAASTTLMGTEMARPTLTPLEIHQRRLNEVKQTLKSVQRNLTSMCWETSLGQELSKVIVFDGIMSIVAPLCIDFLRALFVRYVNQNWCWDMEKTFPQYGDFKIAENILTLINNQGQVWMGIFFSPGLVIINLVKLMIMMYFRSWIVLTCNVPHEVVFKASKSNNFYLSLLLTMLFLCVLPVGYAIVWLRPSWHCGPFSDYNRISEFITNTTRNALPKQLHEPLDYMTSSSTVIPLLLLLILIIYYLVSLTGALREANQDLRTQLQKEREEERKKIFKVPELKPAEPTAAALTNRWRKVLEASSPVTPTQAPDFETDEYKNQARKELISRIMKKALRKGSATSDEESVIRQGRDDDDTDTEHHDSLPHDEETKEAKRPTLSKLQQIRRTRKPSLVDIVQIAKSERERAAGNLPPAKESHPKGRFKVDKHERKDGDKHERKDGDKYERKDGAKQSKQSTSAPPAAHEHDPDINSRVVHERRESLLRRLHEDEEPTVEEPIEGGTDKDDSAKTKRKTTTTPAKADSSNFVVIDEKKSSGDHPVEGRFKLKWQKRDKEKDKDKEKVKDKEKEKDQDKEKDNDKEKVKENDKAKDKEKDKKDKEKDTEKEAKSSAPDVFKFDEKSTERSNNSKTSRLSEIPTTPTPKHLDAELHPTSSAGATPSSQKHQNVDKFASLSRQGRKKIGSLLALVREAVNTKRTDNEPATNGADSDQNSSTNNNANNSDNNNANNDNNNTAIEMPPTPELEAPPASTQPLFTTPTAFTTPSPVTTTTTATSPSTSAASPKRAPLEDPEELDLAGPITFPVRSLSQRRKTMERPTPMRQDSQTSVWSDNIPTITISTTGSEECILDPEASMSPTTPRTASAPSRPPSVVNIIKIHIEDEKSNNG